MQHIYNDKKLEERRKTLRNNQTECEQKLWRYIRNKQIAGHRFQRQYSVGPYILDFYCPSLRLAVEVDGGQHNTDEGKMHDEERTSYLIGRDITVVRFWNSEVLNNIEGVLETIRRTVSPSNSPLR